MTDSTDPRANILIVEDSPTTGEGLRDHLLSERFEVRLVESAEAGLEAVRDHTPDVIVCDIMLPGMDGLEMLRRVKAEYPSLPVLMLTARTDEIDRVMGLEMGADDYIPKPFSAREVAARIKARLRDRSAEPRTPDRFAFGNVEVDLRRRILWKGGEAQHLTTHEAGTLTYLITHRGRDVSRDELLEHVWGYTVALTTRTVDNQILKLRKKIEDEPSSPRHILTVHGTGYRFEA